MIALFALSISTQNRISSEFFLGGVTMDDTQGVGVPSNLSIMSVLNVYLVPFQPCCEDEMVFFYVSLQPDGY